MVFIVLKGRASPAIIEHRTSHSCGDPDHHHPTFLSENWSQFIYPRNLSQDLLVTVKKSSPTDVFIFFVIEIKHGRDADLFLKWSKRTGPFRLLWKAKFRPVSGMGDDLNNTDRLIWSSRGLNETERIKRGDPIITAHACFNFFHKTLPSCSAVNFLSRYLDHFSPSQQRLSCTLLLLTSFFSHECAHTWCL